MGKLIQITNTMTDFHKGLIQGIIATSTNCHSDERTLPNRYKTALKSLTSNHNKGGSVVIMDSTVYNQKLTDLLINNNTYE